VIPLNITIIITEKKACLIKDGFQMEMFFMEISKILPEKPLSGNGIPEMVKS